MSAGPAETYAAARAALRAAGRLALATRGIRIWSESLGFRIEGEDLVCDLREDSQSLANVRMNPRVSFSVEAPQEGDTVQGSGIARVTPGSRSTVTISPYRLSLRVGSETTVIEKRRLQWRAADAGPVGPRPRAGLLAAVRFWLRASRAVSFPLSILPIALGTVLAWIQGAFDPFAFLAALAGGVSVHAGINLISDYNDFRKGVDTTDALSSHPGALVNEEVQPESILTASFFLFLAAAAAGAFLMTRVGIPVMLFGLVGLLGGYFYTSGSAAYKYVGLGEAFISLLMGPLMVLGGFFVQTGRIDGFPFLLSLPLGLLVGSVTLANNLRDVSDDRRARIITLPMRMGVRSVKRLYYALLTAPFAIVVATVAVLRSYLPLLLVVLAVPAAVRAINRLRTAGDTHEDIRAGAAERAYPLNSIRLHLRFGLLLILGCGVSGLLGAIGMGRP